MRTMQRDNLIVAGVVLAGLTATALAVYRPQSRQMAQVQQEITAEKLALEAGAQKVAHLPELLREVQRMKRLYKDFDRRLPHSKELGAFLKEISGILSERDLAGAEIKPGVPRPGALFQTFPIGMTFRGRYLALADFLERMHGMERFTRVRALNVRDPGDGEPLAVQLQLNIYFTEE